MKKISVIMITGIILFLTTYTGFCQQHAESNTMAIAPYHVEVTYNKTTNLIFPYAIKSVDKGSREVLVQKAVGVENVLQLKAAKQGFAETNLTVVTADGSLFPFILNYIDAPPAFSLKFGNAETAHPPVALFAADATTDVVALKARQAAARERTVKRVGDEDNDITLDLKGLYISDQVLYFQFYLKNSSSIDYEVQSLRFSIHDKKKSKRTASQELEMQPLYTCGNKEMIRHLSEQIVCVALPKFTIPDKKYLSVGLMEKNGGRHLKIEIHSRQILKAIGI